MESDERDTIVADLYAGLRNRRLPQDVAADLFALGAEEWLDEGGALELRGLASGYGAWSSMSSTYRRHPGLRRAYAAASTALDAVLAGICDTEVAARLERPADGGAGDPDALRTWIAQATSLLGLDAERRAPLRRPSRSVEVETFSGGMIVVPRTSAGRRGDRHGHGDVRERYSAARRHEELPGVSVRAYRRAVAAVAHLQQRTEVLAAERDRETAIAFGKGRLASRITYEDFAADERTAAFVAYYTARLGMRTVFTSGAQQRPMDTLADSLLTAAMAGEGCRFDVIAKVLTRRSVLTHLSAAERGELLGTYYGVLTACARTLRASFDPGRDRTSMTVRRGDDSSSWNAASRAFNQARTGWLGLLGTLGLEAVLEELCPGKVPALVAADVAAWHEQVGGDTHLDVACFARLPLPWEVVLNTARCPASLVREVCADVGLDADKTGWTMPYRQGGLEETASAPELVHGVAVASPELALALRRCGIFSGQAGASLSEPAPVSALLPES